VPTVTVNGAAIEIGDSERLNLIQAAARAGVEVPHYCWHPALTVVASCRMCLVEVGERKDGQVVMQPRVVPACQTPAKHGTVMVTNSKKAKDAQAATLEYLLLNHPLDCPVCDQAGECFLQDYSYKFGRAYSRLKDDKLLRPDKGDIGEQIALFTDRCVMCSRCVRFTREISGTGELQVIERGDHAEIDIFPGQPCNNKLAGNVVDLCPVGALCSKDFLYKQRVWFLQSKPSVCPDCSTGCSIHIDHNKNILYRLRPRFNPQAQGHFMCDEGRFGFKYVNSQERLTTPQVKHDGKHLHVGWDAVLPRLRRELMDVASRPGTPLAALLSPWMTCEEAFLFAKSMKSLSPQVRLVLGPVHVIGADNRYPKGVRGEAPPPGKEKFTIRAEKCPNRRGVEAVLGHFASVAAGLQPAATELPGLNELVSWVSDGSIQAAYLVGGYPRPWIGEVQAATLARLELLIVQDILPSPASAVAKYVLPGGSFAEKDGTFINHAGLAQAIHRAIQSPGEARPDGRIFMELMERRGLFHAPSVRQEMAKEVPWFAPLASDEFGEYGVLLK
jgi:NADH-quinone oxidoreductase subunit G